MRLGRCGGAEAVGETREEPFQLSFDSALRVAFQGARVTSDGGLILVRELDERLGLSELMERHLSDSRRGKNIQLPLADLLRQSIYSRLAGYADVNDAARLSQDPTFRLIGSKKILERGAALTSRLQSHQNQTTVGGHPGALEIDLQRAIEGELKGPILCLTHRRSTSTPPRSHPNPRLSELSLHFIKLVVH